MEHATSADGTRIAFERTGDGPPVVIVGGAFSTSEAGAPLAAALADVGFTGVTVDRRGRGGSGDTAPYAPEREAEDLAAVLGAVGGGALLGHSSGAILSLLAASLGAPATHLFLSEPPFLFEVDEAHADLPERLQTLVDEGRADEAVATFQRDGVGLPEAVIAQIRQSPMFPQLVQVAQTTVYDATIARSLSSPTAGMTAVAVPVTVLRGGVTWPVLATAAERLAAAIPHAELEIVPESQNHAVDPAGTTRVIARRLR